MNLTLSFLIPALMFFAAVIGLGTYVTVLIVKALRRYTRAEPDRKEKKENTRSLGEVLKQHNLWESAVRLFPNGRAALLIRAR